MRFSFNKYLDEVRSQGRFSITLSELQNHTGLSYKAIQQTLFRAKKRGKIAQIRQGFYVILPPEYSKPGILPVYLYIDDLMRFLNRNYYVGLFSAAALHGAAHQQIMNAQIIIEKPALRRIKNEKMEIDFFVKNKWNDQNVILKKSDAGYFKVASPELTVFDLIYYNKRIGGINRILPILEELSEAIDVNNLITIIKNCKNNFVLQRLGYIYDHILKEDNLADTIYAAIKDAKTNSVPLSVLNSPIGNLDNKWNIIENIKPDF